jgi:hypothetical protein
MDEGVLTELARGQCDGPFGTPFGIPQGVPPTTRAVRSCVASQFADLNHVVARTRTGDRQRCVVFVGLDDREADDDFLGFDIGTVGHDASKCRHALNIVSTSSWSASV